ncbi:hypothetical protein EV1_025356 [Malus domestica]
MASRKAQATPTTNAKNKSILVVGGAISSIITGSKARVLATLSFTPASTLPKEQEHQRHKPVITLASLRALREESPRKYSESLFSDADSSDSTAMQMNEAIVRLTQTMEEKDLQIAALVNRLEAQDDEKPNLKIDHRKKEDDEEDEPIVEKAEEKLKLDQTTVLMGSLSIKQLQEMIASTVKA